MERRFYAIRLWYDGAHFHGWQRQAGLRTVQEALEDALGAVGIRAPLAAAARTDRGVHAVAQVVTFAARAALDPEALRRSLNAALPDDIAVIDVAPAPPSFHARASARSRTYVYLVGRDLPEGLLPCAWSLPDSRAFPGLAAARLDAGAMHAALAHALGTHDFSGFARAPGSGAHPNPTRTVLRAEVQTATWAQLHALVIEANGFLRAMVRNLVGTAVAAGLGIIPPSRLSEILQARGRYRGVRAPGWGLTLAAVAYPEEGRAPRET